MGYSSDLKDPLGDCLEVPDDWTLPDREMCDLEMLLMGSFEPLQGYLTRKQYFSVLNDMRLPTGELWPIPIVLPIPKSVCSCKQTSSSNTENDTTSNSTATPPQTKKVVKLRDKVGVIVGELHVEDVYEPDIDLEMKKVIGSTDMNHPYNKVLDTFRDSYYVGGKVVKFHTPIHFDFKEFRLSAPEVRQFIDDNNWQSVVAFQTRNPMHRSHFELTRQALNEVSETDNTTAKLLLTPVVGPTQPGDVDYHIRVRCYKKIIQHYEDSSSVKLVLLPLAMRMAGPREALWHAIIRRNYGCTHFIVGRDHAGPSAKTAGEKSFYGPYDAHSLIKSVQHELGIKAVFGKNMVYVGETYGGYVEEHKVPADVQAKTISGTEVRRMLERRIPVPEWFSFPDVSHELQKFYRPRHQLGFCVYFTGLPCSGKSTLAVALEAAFFDKDHENRRVTVLDADIIRTHLSQGLGFSRADRKLNVRRIGYVASEVVKHGGICLVANIAPYTEDREFNRRLITSVGGGYVEVFVSTPLEVCESRDIKELYRKARQGVIKQFTGISDPYEVPINPELTIDSSGDIPDKVESVLSYLKSTDWIL